MTVVGRGATAWRKQLPPGWACRRLKHIVALRFSNVDKLTEEAEQAVRLCNYTDVYYNESITAELDFMRASASESEIHRFGVKFGDVLLTKDSETADDIAVPARIAEDLPGVVCGYHLAMLRPKTGHLASKFLLRALQANGIREQLHAAANGVTRFGLGQGAIGAVLIPVPPLPVQAAIADFLDRKTAAIDALIAKKERLIELLEEKRQALITQAVTKGLDPTVPMKDSGVEWLGCVPSTWKLLPMRRMVFRIEQGWSPVAEDRLAEANEWAVLKLSAVSKGRFRPDQQKALASNTEPERRYEIRAGDLLLTRANTPQLVGEVCLVESTPERLMLCDLIYRISTRPLVHKGFLAYWLLSAAGKFQIQRDARGSSESMVKVSQGHIESWIAACPAPHEQARIAAALDNEVARTAALRQRIEAQLASLSEYRQALISAAVTGKLDVRHTASDPEADAGPEAQAHAP